MNLPRPGRFDAFDRPIGPHSQGDPYQIASVVPKTVADVPTGGSKKAAA